MSAEQERTLEFRPEGLDTYVPPVARGEWKPWGNVSRFSFRVPRSRLRRFATRERSLLNARLGTRNAKRETRNAKRQVC